MAAIVLMESILEGRYCFTESTITFKLRHSVQGFTKRQKDWTAPDDPCNGIYLH